MSVIQAVIKPEHLRLGPAVESPTAPAEVSVDLSTLMRWADGDLQVEVRGMLPHPDEQPLVDPAILVVHGEAAAKLAKALGDLACPDGCDGSTCHCQNCGESGVLLSADAMCATCERIAACDYCHGLGEIAIGLGEGEACPMCRGEEVSA